MVRVKGGEGGRGETVSEGRKGGKGDGETKQKQVSRLAAETDREREREGGSGAWHFGMVSIKPESLYFERKIPQLALCLQPPVGKKKSFSSCYSS